MHVPLQLPYWFSSIMAYLSQNNVWMGLIFILASFLLVFFSRYLKWIFLLIFIFIEFFLYTTLSSYFTDIFVVLIGIFSSLIFMPFLYLAIKNGYSITIVNIIMVGYFLLLYSFITESFIIMAISFVILFIISIITFYVFLRLKRLILRPRGESL